MRSIIGIIQNYRCALTLWNMSPDRSMKVKPPRPLRKLWQTDEPTDRPTDGRTDGHREVSLQTSLKDEKKRPLIIFWSHCFDALRVTLLNQSVGESVSYSVSEEVTSRDAIFTVPAWCLIHPVVIFINYDYEGFWAVAYLIVDNLRADCFNIGLWCCNFFCKHISLLAHIDYEL